MGLILIMLAFLTCLLLLLMYKAMWYDQLTCPEGFVLKVGSTGTAGTTAQTQPSAISADTQQAGMVKVPLTVTSQRSPRTQVQP